jgi:hypothetical protein
MTRKLNLFPTLTNKDNVKLYDLLDILTEIESVMLLVENVFEILDSHLEYVQICVKDNDLNC